MGSRRLHGRGIEDKHRSCSPATGHARKYNWELRGRVDNGRLALPPVVTREAAFDCIGFVAVPRFSGLTG